ncbi:MAG TPA: hypothetical protein VGN97_16970 [Mesorhizobium sp.]|jgi:hypothetical protein|nr:hypothetical protein [Mesorhizobium sp.]
MSSKTPEEFQDELALRAHERDHANQERMFASAIDFGTGALRAATLVSGGAVVVGLAFVGAIYGSEKDTAQRLLIAVFVFGLSAVASGAAAGTSYLAQYRYAEASFHTLHKWKHPYVEPTDLSDGLHRKGDFWRKWAIALVVVSYLALLAGIAAAFWALA